MLVANTFHIPSIFPFKMNLKLRGHVVIVDEAHNIEDQCREAASLRLEQSMVNLAKMDCEKLSKFGQDSTSYSAMVSYNMRYS